MRFEYDVNEVVISKHAYERLKERNGWNKKTAERMLSKICIDGKQPEEIKGYLKIWVNKKRTNKLGVATGFILYGNMLYIFRDNLMVTVIAAPSRTTVLQAS